MSLEFVMSGLGLRSDEWEPQSRRSSLGGTCQTDHRFTSSMGKSCATVVERLREPHSSVRKRFPSREALDSKERTPCVIFVPTDER